MFVVCLGRQWFCNYGIRDVCGRCRQQCFMNYDPMKVTLAVIVLVASLIVFWPPNLQVDIHLVESRGACI